MNQRRALVVTLALGLLVVPVAGDAQPAGKVYRIGYMSISSRQSAADLIDQVFLPALRERGLVTSYPTTHFTNSRIFWLTSSGASNGSICPAPLEDLEPRPRDERVQPFGECRWSQDSWKFTAAVVAEACTTHIVRSRPRRVRRAEVYMPPSMTSSRPDVPA